jgi:hypothetical protein
VKGRSLLLPGLAVMTALSARGQVPAAVSTAECEQYPEVTCTSTDAGVNADICQLATDTRGQLGPLLKLGAAWRFPLHIRVVMPDDPLAGTIHEERVAVTATKKNMILEAMLPSSDPDAKAFLQRQFVTVLLWEKFFARTSSFDSHTNLGVVPVWLIEGLNEWISDDPGRDREEIVRRAATIHRAPTLKEITGWEEISQDRLLGLYQRAFCYYLVNSLVHGETKRADFQQWLATFSGDDPAPADFLFPNEENWQQLLLEAPARSHELVYTWDESATALSDAEAIAIPAKKAAETRICTLDTVINFPRDDALTAALQKKVFDLTALELRVHPSWRPIFALYRFGLVALIGNRPDQAQKYFTEAQRQRTAETAYHEKLTDYVNWFEVTRDYAGHTSRFNSYFSTARALERAQADPNRPNSIRADLIQVESQL